MKSPFHPLIAIVGTTGVSKSRLAVELALHIKLRQNAKIINADAMQVYAGLDITTNKMTLQEQRGIEHLLMSFKSPGEQYVVGQWVSDAAKLIDEMHTQQEVPIVVGGTAYWIQHLLFPNRLASLPLGHEASNQPAPLSIELSDSIQSLSTQLKEIWTSLPASAPSASTDPTAAHDLHALLSAIDPTIASRWHWKDSRKVLTSLRVAKDHGKKPSDVHANQAAEVAPRYDTLIFWLFSEPDILNPRLDARVDQMLEQGLLEEIRSVRELVEAGTSSASDTEASNASPPPDYTLGIFQSIGFREFDFYLSSSPNDSEQDKRFREAVDLMKLSTRQYARRQIKWLRSKLLPAVRSSDRTKLFVLDANNLGDEWTRDVRDVALDLTDRFLDRGQLPDPTSLSSLAARILISEEDHMSDGVELIQARGHIICPTCTTDPSRPLMVEQGEQWNLHQRTRRHRRALKKKYSRRESQNNSDVESTSLLPLGETKRDPSEVTQSP
ncbi:tRNA isopentenyltransferase [Sistotremastrum niveocremeum HHB9708]|uniref:tRNA isopentenyltransferase n=2 Tax=Sistotremastraceae TaxID=3402574 RepID=A0A165ALT6_9AGAM|nr:tRNA isopentenyltransferase [Sistotremastrum niveocremeum HHB9708]KZT42065.1 tRNA isopentenyltransferase [Sistotremastrum suecicum HHB10207 ss-3]